ncbi:MAG: PASTA domain-containing protein [Boseongicola sp.]|nr:MAG: PASTA domain-containing protein [Boseongicola sp.]
MTTSNLMSMPVDIPWRRIATSNDMIDTGFGDRKFPARWRPSITVFCYEPPKEEQQLDDRIITFLKVSCTITGLENPLDSKSARVSVPAKYLAQNPWAMKYWKTRNSRIVDYYPCHGALLQVAVFPNDEIAQTPVSKFPIVMDFEPKKREMYYSHTEKNDILSSSRSSIEVKKGTTSTVSQETGWNIGGGASLGSDSGSASFGGGYSSKTTSSVQNVNMVTADLSRERRESYSYVSELSHMYHLLNSYHLGTNRAMFFLQPRPYIAQSEFSFVNGLRKLEGIQEYFLVIARPKDVKGLCVEATLETAHFQIERAYKGRIIMKSQLQQGSNLQKTAAALGLTPAEEDAEKEALVAAWNQISAEKRRVLELLFDVGAGWTLQAVNDHRKSEGVDLFSQKEWDSFKSLRDEMGKESYDPSQTAVVIYEKAQSDSGVLFVFGRSVGYCVKEARMMKLPPEGLVYEKRIPLDNVTRIGEEYTLPHLPLDWAAANAVANTIGGDLMASLAAPERLAYGDATLDEALFIQEPLVEALRLMPDGDPYNIPLTEIDGLDRAMAARLAETFGVARRKDALALDPYQISTALEITEAAARRLRTTLMGEGPRADLAAGEVPVVTPDLAGLGIDAARRMLAEQMLALRPEIVCEDSLEPADSVLRQYPAAGSVIKRGESLSVVTSSGPVLVPDVAGMNVDAADKELARHALAGLQSPVNAADFEPGTVVAVLPEQGSKVARGTQVVLQVASQPRPVSDEG